MVTAGNLVGEFAVGLLYAISTTNMDSGEVAERTAESYELVGVEVTVSKSAI